MPTNLAQAPVNSVEPSPSEFAEKAAEVAERLRNDRIMAPVARLVASRAAARGQGYQ